MTTAAAAGIPGWTPRPVAAYLLHGVEDGVDEPRLVFAHNLTCLISIGAFSSFCLLFLALDYKALWPPALSCFAAAAAQLFSPLIYKRAPVAAYVWLAICVFGALGANSWMTGAGSGIFLFMFSVPALMMLAMELRYPRIVLAATVVAAVITFYVMMFAPQPASFITLTPFAEGVLLVNAVFGFMAMLIFFIYYALRRMLAAEAAIQAEYGRSERLLENLLPGKIAERLKDAPDRVIADSMGQVSIVFADIVDFTPRAASLPPAELVGFLNRVFTAFDKETEARGLEKIKTIGDAYMVAAGMPEARPDHAAAAADMALAMLVVAEQLTKETGEDISIRIGLHTGPAVAGVIGVRKFFYDVWGVTVNTASRMESHGEPGRIQVTAETKEALGDAYLFAPRGPIDIKGKGLIETWWLTGRAE